MDERIFIEKYESEKPMYDKWGEFVTNYLLQSINSGYKANNFLKIPPEPRVKEVNSLVAKAFYRGKSYVDPYNEITDKVGVRFVVLLYDHIDFISNIIETYKDWEYSNDKNYQDEIDANPTLFEYQSKHYIVRNKQELLLDGITINVGTPCEIQIRTLLQHAHSELTHDTTYKPKTIVTSHVKRIVARSIALIETTDCLFKEVDNIITESTQINQTIIDYASEIYSQTMRPELEPRINDFFIDTYRELINSIDSADFIKFLTDKKFIVESIIEKYEATLMYRQPIILVLFYLADKKWNTFKRLWPLTENELLHISKTLGIGCH